MTNKSIHDLIKGSALSSFKLQESATMKLAQEMSQGSHLASLVFKESTTMKSMREMTRASQLASSIFQESAAMKSIQEVTRASQLATSMFQESATMKLAREMLQGSHLASLAFKESAAMKSIREMTQANQFASLAFQESAAMKSVREIIDSQSLADLAGLSSLSAVSQLKNSPFPKSVLSTWEGTATSADNLNGTILEIDSELNNEVSSVTDFNQLPEKSKYILSYIYHTYILPMFFLIFGVCISALYGDELRMALESVSTSSEVRLVELIDRSNRSWLFVEVEVDGELIQGWVSRKYTVYFK